LCVDRNTISFAATDGAAISFAIRSTDGSSHCATVSSSVGDLDLKPFVNSYGVADGKTRALSLEQHSGGHAMLLQPRVPARDGIVRGIV